MFVRVDSSTQVERLVRKEIEKEYDTVIIADYDKGFLTTDDIQYICTHHPQVFLDTKKVLDNWANAARFIKINNHEYERSKEYFQNVGVVDKVIQTMGGGGCCYNGKIYSVEEQDVMDVSGAGDTFMASLVVEYCRTDDIIESIKFANKCASQVVTQRGVTVL